MAAGSGGGEGKDGNAVSLTIVDRWDWSNQAKHLSALQSQFNAYFEIIQGGHPRWLRLSVVATAT
jgi:hypothetical protein